jgi:ATP-dependent DNA ligase
LRIKSCPGAPKETQTIAADNLYSRRNTNQHAARHSGELRSAFGGLPFVIDGEAVVLGIDGIADFNALQSGKQHGEVQFCAFDVLVTHADGTALCIFLGTQAVAII